MLFKVFLHLLVFIYILLNVMKNVSTVCAFKHNNMCTFHAVKLYSVEFVQIISLTAEIENIVEMSLINATC